MTKEEISMNEYKCSRCEEEINALPNRITADDGVEWVLCDCCFTDLKTFLSPSACRRKHEADEEIIQQHNAMWDLFRSIHKEENNNE